MVMRVIRRCRDPVGFRSPHHGAQQQGSTWLRMLLKRAVIMHPVFYEPTTAGDA